ncbi:DUF2637 domain-containing protein [Actinacidiphila bryophytorum]|uniref:DUF2637 domain-containing protein n=1 Tax=Actinacidiphila bryophytorum TaxID=1436133 RepID=UPI002176DFD5|nr:DUF2637 domain-containing protein [Actinacidiphila bryophytorum]UWE13365.1 DUF2637 domain-containing protein [Actinacidiphila bryophytorum]
MPSTPPDARPVATGAFARTTITVVMAVIAALAFVFSFGNVWALALRLGVPRPIAPLIAPMVDLSVVGLLVALHHLAAHGTDPTHLRSATRLMHLCGLLTVALNTAEPLLARHYGRAALDTVAPALLLGWGAVGPTLLRHLHTPTTPPEEHQPPTPAAMVPAQRTPTRASAPARTPKPARAEPAGTQPPTLGKRSGRPPAATMDELLAIARPAVARHGLSVAVVKQALQDAHTPCGSARLTELMQRLRHEEVHATVPPQPEPARTHPSDA